MIELKVSEFAEGGETLPLKGFILKRVTSLDTITLIPFAKEVFIVDVESGDKISDPFESLEEKVEEEDI